MNIAVFEVEDWEQKAFENLARGHRLEFFSKPLKGDTPLSGVEFQALSVFIYSDLTAEVLAKFPRVRLVATRSTGFDHIDMDYCRKNGITVCNVPAYGDNTVAEHVFALLLTISHRLCEAIDRTRKGDFSSRGLQGFDLEGKILGVIGTGSIGRCVIRIARGFGMSVLGFDVKPDASFASEAGFDYVSMDRLLREADILTLHVPANKKTYHLLSREEFEKMKKGVVLINTARGMVVDVMALARALAEGKVAAAGLDVLPEEPLIQEEAELLRSFYDRKYDLERLLSGHILLNLRNVVITPHNAFNTREAVERILETTVKNIEAFTRGAPQNIVGATS